MTTKQVDIESLVGRIRPQTRRSPLPGREHQHWWGIIAYPFDSGHVLALRVSPQNDFAPFTSIWHRMPDGAWSIYVDGPRLDTACPRYWGTSTEHVQSTEISVDWTGPRDLVVEMADPQLRWTASMDSGPIARAANAVSRTLPESVLRSRPAIRLAEWVSDLLFDLGDVTLATPVPNGQDAIALTRRLFPIVDGSARLDGDDLGRPATGADNPTFGQARLPARPIFTIGRAYLTIEDDEEYETTVAELEQERQLDARQPERRQVSSAEVC